MKVLVSGSRDFTDYSVVEKELDKLHNVDENGKVVNGGHRIDCIIHGGARGVDTLAGQYARNKNIPEEVYLAEWTKYGRAAGPLRNIRMLKESKPGLVLCFISEKSRGTRHMSQIAIEAGKPTQAVLI